VQHSLTDARTCCLPAQRAAQAAHNCTICTCRSGRRLMPAYLHASCSATQCVLRTYYWCHWPQIPSAEQVAELSGELRSRAELPSHVTRVLRELPPGTHPMTQLSIAVLALQVRLQMQLRPQAHPALSLGGRESLGCRVGDGMHASRCQMELCSECAGTRCLCMTQPRTCICSLWFVINGRKHLFTSTVHLLTAEGHARCSRPASLRRPTPRASARRSTGAPCWRTR
jgi:Citrate synthase, C-terminal domain